MRVALTAQINGEKRYVGKVIGDTFYRNFPFNNATLWADRELSFDHRILELLQRWKIKKIIFLDGLKREAYSIGIRKFGSYCAVKDFGEGRQVYIKCGHLTKIDYPKVPYVGAERDVDEKDKKPVFDNARNVVSFV